MANPHRGEVQFEAAGKSYTIRLSTNTICGLEAELGVGFGEITRRLDGFNFLTLRSVMRGALGGNASVAEASIVIDELGYAQAVAHIMDAYRLAYPLPNGEDDQASPRMAAEPGIGWSLLTEWIAAGFTEAVFWDCTPRELAVHFKAAGRRFQRENRATLSQAWHTAALYRVKEMPKLGELFDGPKQQTTDDMRNIALMYTQMLGGTVKRRTA